ncbi:response regulator transcription factor [Labrys okinawensis]|uniref:response regulator transcription factor n=1 Tax=Labrys okinawensis TaxID=346911 RepID=UPI001FDF1CC3|nr:response regulator transcription factor [Labrys okinawensis]
MNIALTDASTILDRRRPLQYQRDRRVFDVGSKEAPSVREDKDIVAEKAAISIINDNTFTRDCLTRCLGDAVSEFEIRAYENIREWQNAAAKITAPIILLCATGRQATEAALHQGLDTILEAAADARVIVISDVEDPSGMVAALERGAKGYVPMSLDLDVTIGAVNLVNVGGTFIPASSLLSARGASSPAAEAKPQKRASALLTERQLTVLENLRKGDPNKVIAHKLNMSECTVKVHVRNMMKKIQARNRTELVCMTSELFQSP